MLRHAALPALLLLAACKPAASDEYHSRTVVSDERMAPADPIDSPDTEGASWAPSSESGRLLYGKPGERPLLSLGCEDGTLVYTRYVAADPHAKAVLALIGNGHVERLWIDAEQDEPDEGSAWLWRGRLAADDPRLDVLTGANRVEATVPGAGSVMLNASSMPGEFINRCASEIAPAPEPEESQA
ncbi:hypothetical protein [Qipengyuania sphaerica]|uniref:hypothetical protein n=1 Tax=Qipengyuania sphaerica TaxID=2867243 RepID=UPI001C882F28|nr:hypothetical protein [Qipengyuania sphaerica]MBX7540075.1 hypothetical protein [Qipengyuania sphaerica]